MDELPAIAPPILPSGTTIEAKYVLGEVLGIGGSAVVYDAEQLGLKRRVAFKHYPVRPGTDICFVDRFEREARLLARVHHPNVVSVFDNGTLEDGSPFLVVQRVRGETLATRLRAGALEIDEVVDLAQQVLQALCALGKAGITHRDVKPDNLMLDRRFDDRNLIKLVDFGIAMHVDSPDEDTELVGTPLYMSPEQMRGGEVDVRSDLYGLGATLYEALTGRTPHRGDTLEEITNATLYEPIAPVRTLRPDCPEVLERIVLKALARDRECRYETASEMLKELERWNDLRRTPAPARHHVTSLSSGGSNVVNLPLGRPAPAVTKAASKRASGSQRTVARGAFLAAVACLAALGGWTLSRHMQGVPLPDFGVLLAQTSLRIDAAEVVTGQRPETALDPEAESLATR